MSSATGHSCTRALGAQDSSTLAWAPSWENFSLQCAFFTLSLRAEARRCKVFTNLPAVQCLWPLPAALPSSLPLLLHYL